MVIVKTYRYSLHTLFLVCNHSVVCTTVFQILLTSTLQNRYWYVVGGNTGVGPGNFFVCKGYFARICP